jgi:hypothetical protein
MGHVFSLFSAWPSPHLPSPIFGTIAPGAKRSGEGAGGEGAAFSPAPDLLWGLAPFTLRVLCGDDVRFPAQLQLDARVTAWFLLEMTLRSVNFYGLINGLPLLILKCNDHFAHRP